MNEISELKTPSGITIENYLKLLLETLWKQGDGFSGKRPFGDSGWEYELYYPLARAGLINSNGDADGWPRDMDCEKGHEIILELIKSLSLTGTKENHRIKHQPKPKGDGQEIWPLVLEDMKDKVRLGARKYGTVLKTDNGRDALLDAYQEAIDLVFYLRQAIEERDKGL